MRLRPAHSGLIAAAALLSLVAGCSTPEPPPPPEPAPAPPPPPPPPVTLNEGVAQAASIYVAFMRDMGSIQAGFADAEAIQATIRRGAAYEPGQLSRGMIAYGAIVALQSPEYVAGVRSYAVDPTVRQTMIDRIIADPYYAATLPGADAAAGLIVAAVGQDIAALTAVADSVEADAYTIQERNDPRRRWASQHIANREARLEGAKTLSAAQMLPSAEDSARLFTAAHMGSGLDLHGAAVAPPYTPAIVQSLAIAALAALGAGGEEARANTEALVVESDGEFCLSMSKLNLFQCLAASRPSYEDMFCLGRHIVRDLASCSSRAMAPVASAAPPTVFVEGTPAPAAAAAEAAAATTAPTRSVAN